MREARTDGAQRGTTDRQAESRPLHVRVREILESRLIDGVYPLGSLLPTELELAREFDASRFTIREAMRHLQAQGYVERRQGVGTRVTSARARARYALTVASLEDLFQIESNARFDIRAEEPVELDEELARMVGGEVGERWMRVEGLRLGATDDVVHAAVDAYLPERLVPILPWLRRSREPWFTVLDHHGAGPIVTSVQEISAAPLPRRVARHLSQSSGGCALRLLRRYIAPEGVIFAAVNWHAAEGTTFVIEVHRTDSPPG